MFCGIFHSVIGEIVIRANNDNITSITINDKNYKISENSIIKECKKQLYEYFNKERKDFKIKKEFVIGTEFQIKVWKEIENLKYNEIISYKDLAKKIGFKNSFRAVANACSKNPFIIVIPCHRVVKSNGEIGGYLHGLKIKKYLLELENGTPARTRTEMPLGSRF